MKIIGLTSEPVVVKNILKTRYKVRVVNKNLTKKTKRVIIFTDYVTMINNLKYLNKTPILIESPDVINLIDINLKLTMLNCTINMNGIIEVFKLDSNKLFKSIKNFKCKSIVIEKNGSIGNNSEFSISLNKFLNTIPIIARRESLKSLFSCYCKDDYSDFEKFIKDNRLVTSENRDLILKLESILINIKKSKDKSSLNRIKYLSKIYNTKPIVDKDGNLLI